MIKKTKSIRSSLLVLFFVVFIVLLPIFFVKALGNPASRYCEDLGYKWESKTTPDGDIGQCILPDGTKAEEWSFVTGKVGAKYNYCSQKGYQMKLLTNSEQCQSIFSADCVACILANGSEVEATKLMALESPSGNCKGPYCDRLKKAIGLPQQSAVNNISTGTNEKKSSSSNTNLLVIASVTFLFIILLIIAIIYYIRKRKREDNNDIEYTQPKI